MRKRIYKKVLSLTIIGLTFSSSLTAFAAESSRINVTISNETKSKTDAANKQIKDLTNTSINQGTTLDNDDIRVDDDFEKTKGYLTELDQQPLDDLDAMITYMQNVLATLNEKEKEIDKQLAFATSGSFSELPSDKLAEIPGLGDLSADELPSVDEIKNEPTANLPENYMPDWTIETAYFTGSASIEDWYMDKHVSTGVNYNSSKPYVYAYCSNSNYWIGSSAVAAGYGRWQTTQVLNPLTQSITVNYYGSGISTQLFDATTGEVYANGSATITTIGMTDEQIRNSKLRVAISCTSGSPIGIWGQGQSSVASSCAVNSISVVYNTPEMAETIKTLTSNTYAPSWQLVSSYNGTSLNNNKAYDSMWVSPDSISMSQTVTNPDIWIGCDVDMYGRATWKSTAPVDPAAQLLTFLVENSGNKPATFIRTSLVDIETGEVYASGDSILNLLNVTKEQKSKSVLQVTLEEESYSGRCDGTSWSISSWLKAIKGFFTQE